MQGVEPLEKRMLQRPCAIIAVSKPDVCLIVVGNPYPLTKFRAPSGFVEDAGFEPAISPAEIYKYETKQ